jgi:hypothetical protein
MVGTVEAPGGAPAPAETIEAVIISGPRRGEIVRLSEDAIPEISDQEIKLLNDALDDIIAAIDRVNQELHTTTEALRT